VLFLLIASCSGGGCSSGCSSCGIEPIPGGFPPASTIPNAASVRVTQAGLGFLSANIGTLVTNLLGRSGTPGVIDYPIPTLSTSVDGITINICPNGSTTTSTPPICLAEIEIGQAALTVSTATPDNITLNGTIPIRARDIQVSGIPIIGDVDLALGSNGQCTNGGGSDADFADLPISISLPLVAQTTGPHVGYTMIDGKNATVNITIASGDIKLCAADCGILGFLCNAILGLLPGTIASDLAPQLDTQVQNILEADTCTKANSALTPPCPTGTQPAGDGGVPPVSEDGGVAGTEPDCVLTSDPTTCLPIELGTEGNLNVGKLLASISSGTSGYLNFMIAGGGNMNPANSGMTLGMLGGASPAPQSSCVPVAANPAPSGLVIPDVMLGNTEPVPSEDGGAAGGDAGPPPDLGIAIDGQFLNYAMGSLYNSGLLCLGVTTDSEQELNTGLVSFLVPSLKYLTFEQKGAAMAITTRPQQAPIVTIGDGTDLNNDPLLSILMKSFAIDFYVWSEDRYVRAFTFTADLTIPVNITSSAAGILPAIGTIGIANGTVTNNELITDSPATVANALSSIIGSLVGQLLGSGFSPINLSSALSSYGLGLSIPPNGIQKITQGSENYLGIFADLQLATAAVEHPLDTSARLANLTVHPEGMSLTTVEPATAPSIAVQLGSDSAGAPVEYAWRLDQGTWSEWSSNASPTIKDPMLYMQAKHTLYAKARVAGHVMTEDPTPAQVPFTIDVLPPIVTFTEQSNGGWAIQAQDIVSPPEALVARTRGTDASGNATEWTAWSAVPTGSVGAGLSSIEVQVRDENGNVADVTPTPELIRGRPDPTLPVTGGCSQGCTAASQSGGGWAAVALGIAGIAALFARRRGSRAASAVLAAGSIVAVASTSQGCSCGGSGGAEAGSKDGGLTDGAFEDGANTCGSGCSQPCGPALPQGLIGAYTSIAKASDGTLWVAGYNDSANDPANGISAIYGDLVVGKYDATAQQVDWATVDGLPPPLPAGTCVSYDPSGWRGGDIDPGPDVGLWTSLQVDANGHPMVAYYDATTPALKFASSSDGTTWAVHTVYSNTGSDVGRYAKMIVVNGMPVIAFLVIDTGTNGYSTSRVVVAQANVALPAQGSDWTLSNALVDNDSPCRAQDCTATQACVISTGMCTALASDCDASCGTGESCIQETTGAACEKTASSTQITDYPDAIGDYISLAQTSTGLGMLVYDRIHGTLLGLTNAGGSWTQTILDGQTGSIAAGTAVSTGDDGVGANLFVAANGDWHASYVDGITETLKYLYIPGGTPVTGLTPQIVDNGYAVDGTSFTDGMHIVGDDSNIQVQSDGSVTIVYQDATAGTLRIATGSQTPGTWTLHAISQPNEFAGYFPHFVPSDTKIANWWRWADQTTQQISGNVAIVAPQ
jgi:hypothetical protein